MGVDGVPLLDDKARGSAKTVSPSTGQAATFIILTASLCISGAANDLLSKVVANTYTQRFAFFVDQGNNIVYALFSAIPVAYLFAVGGIPEETRKCPQRKYAFMGLLDAFGTYLSSVGAVHTPGQLQTVLGQVLIPISMLSSATMLGARYTWQEIASATTVFLGACVAVVPALLGGGIGTQAWPPAIVIYLLSNLPMALSNVYKELGFVDMQLNVFYLTYIVVVYQTAWSFGLLLLQTMPYLSGSSEGLSLSKAWDDFVGGAECFIGMQPEEMPIDCSKAGFLLVVYVMVNLGFNWIGLLLVKAGSEMRIGAVLCSLAFAVKLPVSTFLFSSPLLMGSDAEPLKQSTCVGLACVVVGFLWHVWAGQLRAAEATHELEDKLIDSEETIAFEEPWGFHERVVGCVATAAVRPRGGSRSRSSSPARGPRKGLNAETL